MRSITFVQAFQFWLKLAALAIPVVALLIVTGAVEPAVAPTAAFPAEAGPGGLDVYRTVSLMVALLLGTLGLPHVLVRFYTNPDGPGRAPDDASSCSRCSRRSTCSRRCSACSDARSRPTSRAPARPTPSCSCCPTGSCRASRATCSPPS